MKNLLHGHCFASPRFAPLALAVLIAGCGSDDSGAGGPGGVSASPAFSGNGGPVAPAASPASGGTGTVASGGSSEAPANISGGLNLGTGGASGGTSSGSEGTNVGSGGTDPSNPSAGSGGTAVGSGGTDATSPGPDTTPAVTPQTVELIGPGTARCGATNATHGDGFVCVLNYPSEGPNVVGYWFDYAFAPGTCNLGFTKPSGNADANPQVCFSGSACPATSGGGLGVALCDVHGIDVSTWPQLAMLETESSLSSTLKSPVSGCNPGATIPTISWTLGSGSIPAGASVLFDDAADVTVARVDNLPAGATSVDVPANVDASQVATIKFSVSGSSSTSWDFCLTSLTVSLR